MSIYFSEQSGHRSGTYEVFNLHDNVLLASGLIHFPEKRTKGTVEIIRVVSGEAMYRPASGFVVGFPSKLGCGTIYGHVGENAIKKFFVRSGHRELDVATGLIVEG